MDKAQVLREIAGAHAEMERLLAPLSEEQMTRPGVYGDLSVKDVLAHIAAWERLDAGWIAASFRGETPVRFAPGFELGSGDDEVLNRLNEHIFQKHKDKPLPEVLDDFRAAHARMLETVSAMSESDLTDPHRFDWWDGEPIWTSIADNSYEHEREHIELIREWLKK